MVQEDERKLDLMSKRHTELTMVNNNSKLLNEMLDLKYYTVQLKNAKNEDEFLELNQSKADLLKLIANERPQL